MEFSVYQAHEATHTKATPGFPYILMHSESINCALLQTLNVEVDILSVPTESHATIHIMITIRKTFFVLEYDL
jgi:hypothetical protein